MPHTVTAMQVMFALTIAAPAGAQVSRGDSGRANAQPKLFAPDTIFRHKSETGAFVLSLASSVVPILLATHARSGNGDGIILLAVLIGPAVGHFYARQPGRAWQGIGLRTGILVLTALLFRAKCTTNEGESCGNGVAGVAGIAELLAMAIDVLAAPASAKKFNRGHSGVTLVPLAGGEGRVGFGMRLVF